MMMSLYCAWVRYTEKKRGERKRESEQKNGRCGIYFRGPARRYLFLVDAQHHTSFKAISKSKYNRATTRNTILALLRRSVLCACVFEKALLFEDLRSYHDSFYWYKKKIIMTVPVAFFIHRKKKHSWKLHWFNESTVVIYGQSIFYVKVAKLTAE